MSGDRHDASGRSLELHRKLRGKITIEPRAELNPDTLELLYTPGVGAVSRVLADDPSCAPALTGRGNTVAVISDGSAVLGLGDEGPLAALPVLEGKSLLFQALAGISAVPLALNVEDAEGFVAAVKAVAPSFGAVNLEDVAAPDCFVIERRLQADLEIPVVHDDQHCTAIVVLAGLINAARVTGRALDEARTVVVGAGASGTATARLLRAHGVRQLAVADSHGTLSPARDDLDGPKQELVEDLNLEDAGDAREALRGADVVIGLSVPDAFDVEEVRAMRENPIVFALANPDPEVSPGQAREAGAAVVATGRSDYPNQVNNVLAFPGLFRGLLDCGHRDLTDSHSLRAAEALAGLIEEPREEEILPSVFDERIVPAVAKAVATA